MIARFSERAEREMKRIDARWRVDADYAPDLFRDEVLEMIEDLEKMPKIGLVFDTVDDRVILRVHLKKSRYHVYYTIEGNDLEVVSIWSAQRKRAPKLGPKR